MGMPYRFTNGTVADADEVNANFDFLNHFGDGSDGAHTGNVTWTVGTVYNYTSVNITSIDTITISGSGKPVFIRVTGNCAIDGTNIDLSGKGFAGGAALAGGDGWYVPTSRTDVFPGCGGAASQGGVGGGGGGGASLDNPGLDGTGGGTLGFGAKQHYNWVNATNYVTTPTLVYLGALGLGTGGGGGHTVTGGDGGGCIVFIVGGNLSLTTMTIDVSGNNGSSDATNGGGGGGAGYVFGYYSGTLTNTALTITANKGLGGSAPSTYPGGDGGDGGSQFSQLPW